MAGKVGAGDTTVIAPIMIYEMAYIKTKRHKSGVFTGYLAEREGLAAPPTN
jgi:hypothetical protein